MIVVVSSVRIAWNLIEVTGLILLEIVRGPSFGSALGLVQRSHLICLLVGGDLRYARGLLQLLTVSSLLLAVSRLCGRLRVLTITDGPF